MRILLVTGISGAGKSVTLKTLEDMGWEAVDNTPLPLIASVISSLRGEDHRIVIGTDVRSRDFSVDHFREMFEALKKGKCEVQLLFLDCDDDVLQRRFTETRRKHPLALDRPIIDGIVHERSLVSPLKELATTTLDTSQWSGGELRQQIRNIYGEESPALSLFVSSFSFRHGVPRDADLIFDVRFLRNPFYDTQLRALSGLDAPVADFIESDPDFKGFFDRLTGLLLPLLPRYLQEGKSYLTVAVGCTGGQHRSVYVAEKLAGFLKQKEYKVGVRHRDLNKEH